MVDERFMKLAIQLAKMGQYQTYTNPLVGAVIVKDQQVIGTGAHLVYGQGHAERNAINGVQAEEALAGATLYVTLEPCNHTGKQPPCTQLIAAVGIQKVVIGQLDPNPQVAGKGVAFLKQHGIEVAFSTLTSEVEALNRFYNFYYRQQRPWVTLKQAVTLDGRLSADATQRLPLTDSEAWQKVHTERQNYQGILVGSQTALVDDPTLRPLHPMAHPPVRIILDRRGRVFQKKLRLWTDASAPVYVFTTQAPTTTTPKHVHVLTRQTWPLEQVLATLAKMGLQSVYVEGGAQIHQSFLAAGLWDDLITYIAPKLLGQGVSAFGTSAKPVAMTELEIQNVQKLGPDIRIQAKRRCAACSQD